MSEAALVPDPDGRGGMTVLVDGQPQSFVDPADPTRLEFEYVRLLAAVLDTLPAGPLPVTHLGGGGLTLPRYLHATRPGSPQVVLEPDAALTAVVRERLPLPRGSRIRVRPVDGRRGLAALGEGSARVLVLDAYAGGRVPAELTTLEALGEMHRVLGDGMLLANLADERDRRYLARVVAGVAVVFGDHEDRVLLAGPAEVVKGRRFGNTVLAASSTRLDTSGLRRAVVRVGFPTAVRSGGDLRRLAAGAAPWTDADGSPSPEPPAPDGSWRRR